MHAGPGAVKIFKDCLMNRCGVSSARAQRGGTVLGFVLGVLVGLAVALGVAVYVTKVPVPFVDRVISRKSSEDSAEAERNRDWNPNAILNGGRATSAGGEPAPAAAPTAPAERPELLPPPAKAGAPMPAAGQGPAAPVAPAAAKGKTYSSSPDPLGDLAAQQTQGKSFGTAPAGAAGSATSASAGASGSAESFMYFVQVGAYRTPEDAQSQRARLVLMGLDANVTEREQGGRTVYRVRLGPFQRQADAEQMKDTLQPSGFEAALVRVQR